MNNTSPSPLLSYKGEKQKQQQFSFPPHNFVIDIVTQQQTIQNSGKKRQHRKINELIPIRFVILAVSLFCLSILIANPLALNFTVICMYKEVKMVNNEGLTVNFLYFKIYRLVGSRDLVFSKILYMDLS
ncbi:unnamed protein product [Meloidogyne enterolobii]|uniref:Uncharacterized protein n=1 Tax=Meloidogyne enterolobii TaxID=390850 RepID=A0ACB0YGV1_MELEN